MTKSIKTAWHRSASFIYPPIIINQIHRISCFLRINFYTKFFSWFYDFSRARETKIKKFRRSSSDSKLFLISFGILRCMTSYSWILFSRGSPQNNKGKEPRYVFGFKHSTCFHTVLFPFPHDALPQICSFNLHPIADVVSTMWRAL